MSASVIELISFIKEKHSVTSVSSPNRYPVRWIYQLEDPAAAGTLGVGALVVTTGLMMKDDPEALGKMLTGLRDAMAAGLILVGWSFPPETVGSAGIPLFTMPAGTDIASLMYDCCHFLTRQEAKELTVVKAFKSILMNGSVSDGAARYLEQHGYPAMTKYFVMCFRPGTSQTHAQSAIEPPSVPGTRRLYVQVRGHGVLHRLHRLTVEMRRDGGEHPHDARNPVGRRVRRDIGYVHLSRLSPDGVQAGGVGVKDSGGDKDRNCILQRRRAVHAPAVSSGLEGSRRICLRNPRSDKEP